MKIAAIIAEYNPFHNGHLYHLNETKRITGADYIIAVMSGNFVQRGAPALCNKYLRTKMALACGVDVVIELPSLYATSSAEYFAQAGVTLLNKLGTIDYLSFGSECGDISILKECAKQLIFPSSEQDSVISHYTSLGMPFPAARQQMLFETVFPYISTEKQNAYTRLLNSPNNILGLEYCKSLLSLSSNIKPVTIKRNGGEYHDTTLNDDKNHYASASSIRYSLKEKSEAYITHLPSSVNKLMKEHQISTSFIMEDDFSSLLHYKLLSEEALGFTRFLDCTPDLSDKIKKHLPCYQNITQFCNLLKSKNITHSRISRVLFHILLNQYQHENYMLPLHKRDLFIPYARLLGFRREASPLLSAIKQHSDIPLIGNVKDASKYLTENGLAMLSQDIYTCNIYEIISSQKNSTSSINEYKQSPIIL